MSTGAQVDDIPYARGAQVDDIPYARSEPPRGSQPKVEAYDEEAVTETPSAAWGHDDDSPLKAVSLASEFPADAPGDDFDPLTYALSTADGVSAVLGDDVASVVGVRFVPAGRIQWYDAGDSDYLPGDRVLVDADRGTRLAWIATQPTRRATRDRGLRRVIRRANEQDLRGEKSGDDDRVRALRIAKDSAAALKLPLKVFRIELSGNLRGGKLNVYYTSDDRLDLRDFVRDVSQQTGSRLELRQLGVRDEAKVVGGIGSCGLTLCCTTWLPEFVPVSIKMAKDQGLVLSPTKVSGQCGRLKCCLVYEQAGYAEMRKGLPKLGKRVIAPRGEGRVVEVDVLRQRVRVSYGPGDTEVLPAAEVKPMFPSANQQRQEVDHDPSHDPSQDSTDGDLPEDDPSAPSDA
jgi:cell fate regulator YaaT (PSP1 superfamily)